MADDEAKPIVVDSFSPWERRLEKHGWPTLLLCIGGLIMWRVMSWFGPKIDEGLNAHFSFMKKTEETQAKQAENGKELAEQQIKIGEILDRQERRTEEMADRIKDVHKAVIKAN